MAQTTVRESLTSPYTAFRVARAPGAAADTMEWLVRRLPDIGRQTLRTLSAGERLIPYTLRLLRRAAVLAVIGALGLAVIKPDVSSEGAFGRFILRIADNPWPAVTIGVLMALVLSSFIRRIED
jgi:hypothetical protein